MRTGKKWLIAAVLALVTVLWALPAAAADYSSLPGQEVRVLLTGSSTATSYSITISSGTFRITPVNDRYNTLATVSAGNTVTFNRNGSTYSFSAAGQSGSGSTAYMAVPSGSDDCFNYNGRDYRGCFKAMYSGSYYYAINQINVELYIYGVIGKELGYGFSDQSLMTQAVASRSYALANYSSSNVYYDLTSGTSSQVYGGKSGETDQTRRAVDNTRGYVLKYNDRYVQTYYSSNMGGYTENIENVWESDAVPIRGVPSPHDSLAYKYGKTDIGSFVSISYSDTLNGVKSVSGRAMTVTITGTNGSVTAKKDNIRSLLDLKSTLIDITDGGADGDVYVMGKSGVPELFSDPEKLYAKTVNNGVMLANGEDSNFYARSSFGKVTLHKQASGNSSVSSDKIIINGKGYGHGVGMSQFGVIAMGDEGYTWQQMIEHYFCGDNGIRLVDAY